MPIHARRPTSAVPYPFILLEGEEKAGKSWAMIELSASARVGASYIIDLGEGGADEYGAIPGADFYVIEHDGTYASILEQVMAVKDEAARAKRDGEPPVMLGIDSMTDMWDGLKDWVSDRARMSKKNQQKLAQDPAAELDVSRNLWNDAGNRYRRLMTQLLTFPGIVVVTARGKEVSATDPTTGQPYRDGRKDYTVQSHKSLPFDATAWLRMSRTRPATVVGIRSVKAGIRPGLDDPQPVILPKDAKLLDWLVFDAMGVGADSTPRDLKALTGGELSEDEKAQEQQEEGKPLTKAQAKRTPPPSAQQVVVRPVTPQELTEASTFEQLTALWERAEAAGQGQNEAVKAAFGEAEVRIESGLVKAGAAADDAHMGGAGGEQE